MKINLKVYSLLTLANLCFFYILNDQPRSYGLWFSLAFIMTMVVNQVMLIKMVQTISSDGRGALALFYGITKFIVLASFFYIIATYYEDILILSVSSYLFQLIILVISIKRYVSKIRKN